MQAQGSAEVPGLLAAHPGSHPPWPAVLPSNPPGSPDLQTEWVSREEQGPLLTVTELSWALEALGCELDVTEQAFPWAMKSLELPRDCTAVSDTQQVLGEDLMRQQVQMSDLQNESQPECGGRLFGNNFKMPCRMGRGA